MKGVMLAPLQTPATPDSCSGTTAGTGGWAMKGVMLARLPVFRHPRHTRAAQRSVCRAFPEEASKLLARGGSPPL